MSQKSKIKTQHSAMPKLSTRHEAPVRFCFWKEEQRKEREATFDARHKKSSQAM